MRIDSLEIDEHILDKIESKHVVSFEEVEEVCYASPLYLRRGRGGLYQAFGQTDAGRYLFVVLARVGTGSWKVVTARVMRPNERRLYLAWRGAEE